VSRETNSAAYIRVSTTQNHSPVHQVVLDIGKVTGIALKVREVVGQQHSMTDFFLQQVRLVEEKDD